MRHPFRRIKLQPGGLRGFVEKFGFRCNEKIASFMGGDIDAVIQYLLRFGLVPLKEFLKRRLL